MVCNDTLINNPSIPIYFFCSCLLRVNIYDAILFAKSYMPLTWIHKNIVAKSSFAVIHILTLQMENKFTFYVCVIIAKPKFHIFDLFCEICD
jgi:hypothetical protein